MADKNIGTFDVGDYADITHAVAVPAQGVGVDVNPILVPKAQFVGPQGPQGPQGPAGPAGATGATGAQGVPGPSVVPDEYGIFDEAKVSAIVAADVDWNMLIIADGDDRVDKTQPPALNGDMSGHLVRYETAGNEWFDLGPIVGVAGPAGADGAPGAAGAQGIQGPKGDTGDPGVQGPAGPQGATGLKGDKGDTGATGPAGADGVVPKTTIVTVSTTAHTLQLENAEKYHRFSNAAAKAITVPTNAAQAFPFAAEGETTTIAGINTGAGLLTLAAAGGVTLNKKTSLTLTVAQWGVFVLTKVGTDVWDVSGDLEPV